MAANVPYFDIQKLIGIFRSFESLIKAERAKREREKLKKLSPAQRKARKLALIKKGPGLGGKLRSGASAISKGAAQIGVIIGLVKIILSTVTAFGETLKRLGFSTVGQGLADIGRKITDIQAKISANLARAKAGEISSRFASSGLGALNLKNAAALSDQFYANQLRVEQQANRNAARGLDNGLQVARALIGLGN